MKSILLQKQIVLIYLLLNIVGITNIYAETIAVVVSAKDSFLSGLLTKKQVEHIFLRKSQLTSQGDRIIPVNLSARHPLRAQFTQEILQKSQFELERYWYEQYFNGVSPPRIQLAMC